MKPSTSGTGSASVTSTTGAKPKKRTQSKRSRERNENAERTITLDSDTNSPSTSQQTSNLANSRQKGGLKSQSRKKSSLSNRQNRNAGYNNNMRRSSSSGTSTGGSPNKRIKKKGKSLKQQLRETVLDESADWRQRFRQTEEKHRQLQEKLSVKKNKMKTLREDHSREIQRITDSFNAKAGQETDRHFKEKAKIEKELRNMTKRAEKAELDLIKAESVKTVQGGSGEALFQDMLGNLKEFMEGQLQCSICNEIYVYPSVISCGHTFCEDCIEGWKKKQPNTTCPICRSDIIITSPNQVMEQFIEKFVDNFFPDDAKKARLELIADRKAKKEARETKRKSKSKPILSAGTRRRILNLESDDNGDDSDSSFGLMFNAQLPDLDSPSRYSTASSVASSLSRNRDGMVSTPNWSGQSDVEYNFSSDSDSDNSYQPGQDIEDVDLSLLDVLEPSFNIDAEDSDHFSHDDEEDGNNDTDADDGAVTPNEDSTDDDDSDDDDDDDNDDEAEVRFEFPGNTGWPAFSDSD